ncbi:MAG: hypothetical protein KDI00_05800 [Pseudomonadales bacterium]|nr:hypothetical protein [Pseudomonadales bacterium]
MTTWSKHHLNTLAKQGYLVPLHSVDLQQQASRKNQAWQHKLMNQAVSFLTEYDLLFRRLTQLLILQGYDFSNVHPHQTLKKLLLLLETNIYSNAELSHLVECRHNLKYGFMDSPTPQAIALLDELSTRLKQFNA